MPSAAVLGITVVLAYLVGAVPFGYLIARARGVDIFKHGSGNIGATNVGRVLGRRFGILCFMLDFAKGAVPVAVAQYVSSATAVQNEFGPDVLPVAAGLAAFLGHLFPVYLRFRGGKGVATAAGVVTVLLPLPALAALFTWIVVVCLTRYVSLASLAAAAVLPAFQPAVMGWNTQPLRTALALVAGVLIFVKHRSNIGRLARGTENRLENSPAMMLLTKTLHVLALGLWFGTVVFFTLIVAVILLHTFQGLAVERPPWLPVASDMDKDRATRLFGFAIGPLFPWFFAVQGLCGLIAVVTALSWPTDQPSPTIAKIRTWTLIAALVTVVAGWPLAQKVSTLRLERYSTDPAVAKHADEVFGTWHLYSLSLTFVTMLLVGVAMALAAQLPVGEVKTPEPARSETEGVT